MTGDHKSGFALEMERLARKRDREDARQARAEQRSRTYTGADLRASYEIDPETSCWLWTGEFRRYGEAPREMPIARGIGKHELCGIPHNAMSRVLYEEHIARKLKRDENVMGTCASNHGVRHACVNPEHHELRHGAGIMFAREMVE